MISESSAVMMSKAHLHTPFMCALHSATVVEFRRNPLDRCDVGTI